MSLSLWVVVIIVITVCTIIFTKTVSNDAANDYKLRDILSKSPDEEENGSQKKLKSAFIPTEEEEEAPMQQSYEDYEKQTGNIYEEMVKEQNSQAQDFGTKVHETAADEFDEDIEEEQEEYKEPQNNYQEEVYYEKINDDACDFEEEDEENYCEVQQKKYPKKSGLLGFVKTFWRGITFSVGLLVCLYSLIGILNMVQTSNDAIIYSLWLLIGVILIK